MTTQSSKFTGFFDSRGKQEQQPEHSSQGGQPTSKTRGGKRANPDFVQVAAYIHKDTHKAAKKALLDEEEPREFSELVQDLLNEWLKMRI